MPLVLAAVVIAGFAGWVMNIVTIATTFSEFTGLMIVRIIGVFIAQLEGP